MCPTFQEMLDYLDNCLTKGNELQEFMHLMEDARLHEAHKQLATFQISLVATEQ